MRSNISNPPMRTGSDFKSLQFDPIQGEAKAGSNCKDLKSGPVRIGGFEMTSQTSDLGQ